MIAFDAPWTDQEVSRYVEREERFTRKQDDIDALLEAEIIAGMLHNRDRDIGDDRISCGECRQGKSAVCKDVAPKPWDVLNRCDYFQSGPFDADTDLPVIRRSWSKPKAVTKNEIPHASDF